MKKRIKFPEVTDVDIAFGNYPEKWFQKMLQENSPRKYKEMASNLFFNGGDVPFNEDLPVVYLNNGFRILRTVLGSFKPKHEHKEHVAGVVLKNICEKE
jgi:hypothetical protein